MAFQSKYTGEQIETKLDNMQQVTAGNGIRIQNGVIECTFTPTKYYTGSTEPSPSTGNNGDIYMQISE